MTLTAIISDFGSAGCMCDYWTWLWRRIHFS